MIDEKRLIAKLQNRIDIYVKDQPDQKNSVAVAMVQELIHTIQLEAEEESEIRSSHKCCEGCSCEDEMKFLVKQGVFDEPEYNCYYCTRYHECSDLYFKKEELENVKD